MPDPHELRTPRDSARLLTPLLQDEASEVFVVVLLSTREHVLAYQEVSRGTLDSTLVHPREVFKAAILANAAAVILALTTTRAATPRRARTI